VRNTISPKVYLIGRNREQANRIETELKALNPDGEIKFIQSDISLLESVDRACAEIQAAEEKLNLLFMTAGYLTLAGRNGKFTT
jgi:NAD(P)-dependent dehydrogenase (short-subunit alcohol dehydrogenase family)